jgi:type 1 glutamine amidotransferase
MPKRTMSLFILAAAAVSFCLLRTKAVRAKAETKKLLYLTMSAGYKHEVIPFSKEIVKQIGEKSGAFETTDVQDVTGLMDADLSQYDAVMFYTTGELPLSEAQKNIFSNYISAGHGFIGVHSATDTLYTWDKYLRIVGGYFDGHPWHQTVTVDVGDPDNKIVKFLGRSFQINDEIYQISDFQWRDSKVLLRLDPNSVDLSKSGLRKRFYNWPLAWTRKYGKGKVFYTALGHEQAVWQDPRFQELLLNGIKWTMGDFKE